MKMLITFFTAILAFSQAVAQNQHKIITDHPLYPFNQYNGDTLAYLTLNFDGGADYFYDEQPFSKFLQDLDPAMPIRTFYPRYLESYNLHYITSFVCFPYTKEELKRLIKEGKPIYGIDLGSEFFVTLKNNPALFNYFKGLGFERILPWTAEIEQKIGSLSFYKGYVQDVTDSVKQFLENHPE